MEKSTKIGECWRQHRAYIPSPAGNPGRKERVMAIGTYVINFETIGIIREVRADGSLVLENPRIGRWIADPAKCEVYRRS